MNASRFRRAEYQQRVIQRQRRAALRQGGECAGGIPLVAAFGDGLENPRLAAARILTARVFSARVLTAWVSSSWVSSWIFTSRVFASRILAAGLFLRDGQIDGVGALVERHVQEGGFRHRPRELTVNSPSEVKMR